MNKLFLTLALAGLMAAPQMHAAFSDNQKYALAAVAGAAALIGAARAYYQYVSMSSLLGEANAALNTLVVNNGWLTVTGEKQAHFINCTSELALTSAERGTCYPCSINSRLPEGHIQQFKKFVRKQRQELAQISLPVALGCIAIGKAIKYGAVTAAGMYAYNYFKPA